MGWSRSGVEVRAALVNSKYKFKAALLVDAESRDYLEYLALQNWPGDKQRDLQAMNRATPIGRRGLKAWIDAVDEYGVGRQPPLKLYAFGPLSLFLTWESYVIYRHLGLDVDLQYLPDAAHDPVKPLERSVVQQGAVDWFSRYLSTHPSGGSLPH